MTPLGNGCVGINKMTPICALDVNGDGCISGKLGINNTTPSCALDVNGDGKISGTLTTNNLTVNGSFSVNNLTTGNITNTNQITTTSFQATGLIEGGNINTAGNVSAQGYLKGSNIQFQNNITMGYYELYGAINFTMYYQALNATCYFSPSPLVIKDNYTDAISNFHLTFPCPEMIYLDLTNNDITITLPYVNQFIGNVDVSGQIFSFKVRQTKTGPDRYWHLKTHTHEPNFIPTNAIGGTIHDFQNAPIGTYYKPGAWYMEVHYYKGDWYTNRFN
jgi:cytoskeletal protein CcmA (bactofilin family)